MKILSMFGLVSILCTFAIIAYMWGKIADSQSSTISNVMAGDYSLPDDIQPQKAQKSESKKPPTAQPTRLLPKPFGIEIKLKNISTLLLNYQLNKGESLTPSPGDKNSNSVLRKLITNTPDSEKIFFLAGSFVTTQKPNGIATAGNLLTSAENHWAFIYSPDLAVSSGKTRPMLIEPFRKGESTYRASDYGPGRGVICLFSDGSIQTLQIDGTGAPVMNGVSIISSNFSAWKGKEVRILQPEF